MKSTTSKKHSCSLPCTNYDKVFRFLRCPDELDANQEIESRDWDAWRSAGACYGKLVTGSGREVQAASQIHGQVDAVCECPWNSVSRLITHFHAIKLIGYDRKPIHYQIIAAINVDENNVTMQYICRKTSPSGVTN